MTDRELMQQALDALVIAEVDGNCDYEATELLRTRLAHCDRCGKRLGGEGDIHTCTPDPIGDAQSALIAEMAAQPEQEPVAYAGIKMWVGNQQVVQLLTETELQYATQPWLHMLMNAEKCIAALKEKNT